MASRISQSKSLIPLDKKKNLMDWSWYFADYNIAGWYLVAGFLGQLHKKRRFAREDLSCLRIFFL